MRGTRLILYSSLLTLAFFSFGRPFITGINPNACYIVVIALLLGTTYLAIQLQKLELGCFTTLAINLFLIALFFSIFYLGINSIEIQGPARRYYPKEDNDAWIFTNNEQNQIVEFTFRADVVQRKLKFLFEMIALAREKEFLITDKRGNIVEPEIERVLRLIKTSNAFNFLKNPMDFLEDLNKGDIEIE